MEESNKEDGLLKKIEEFNHSNRSSEVKNELVSQLEDFFKLFPMEEKELFIQLLEMVNEKDKTNFLRFTKQFEVIDNPLMQVMLLQMLAPYRQINTAVRATIKSGEIYEIIMSQLADKFFKDLSLLFGKWRDDLQADIAKMSEETHHTFHAIEVMRDLLNRVLKELPATATASSQQIQEQAKTHLNELDMKMAELMKTAKIDLQKRHTELEGKMISALEEHIKSTIIHKLNSWTGWLGGIFIAGAAGVGVSVFMVVFKVLHFI